MALANAGELGATAPTVNGRRKKAEMKCQYSAGDEANERVVGLTTETGRAGVLLAAGWLAIHGLLISIVAAGGSEGCFCAGQRRRDAKHGGEKTCAVMVALPFLTLQAAQY
ncbi:MAG: hypothetical protein ABSE59_01820 [Opitutaceae bacterium]|jgi:hypothetical protein